MAGMSIEEEESIINSNYENVDEQNGTTFRGKKAPKRQALTSTPNEREQQSRIPQPQPQLEEADNSPSTLIPKTPAMRARARMAAPPPSQRVLNPEPEQVYQEPPPRAETPVQKAVIPEPTSLDRTTEEVPEEEFTAIDLPSKFTPYDWKSLHIRPFGFGELMKISAVPQTNNITPLVEAIGNCINRPVRELTTRDFQYLMLWLRMNSYTKSPYVVDWMSMYGNKQKSFVQKTSYKVIELAITRERLEEWWNKGFDIPRVADYEARINARLDADPERRWGVLRAEYLIPQAVPDGRGGEREETAEERYNRAKDKGKVSMAEDIRDFAKEIGHGVDEYITVRDEAFNLDNAITHLESIIPAMMGIENISDDTIVEYSDELTRLKNAKQGGVPVQAKDEKVPLDLNVLRFFPEL
jgi:hypothetical protein